MAWQDEMVLMARVILNDLCESPTYSDSKLEQLLIVAAHYVVTEIDLSIQYDVSISDMTITPDPTDDPKDTIFLNFVVLKAACLADQGNVRLKAALSGLKAQLGPAMLNVSGDVLKGYITILENGPCKTYEEMKLQWQFGNGSTVRAILSPFVGNNFDPSW